ncbi:helix-turn-helix domain-containing protein [Defluviimonas salinarum]|uniref:Helix-turn-helix domain-containing protein n=1 Tax=Defluviimonas salinarum TaxID=2992147 RepID=A0ABT3J4E7_9RHOB|nr:helix-turn-helix transcriptional regulator [Defluviimonas salinarum]MCW3782548.1 helix-turn-helix domain-containing protein [Defluviimonas salinarum]
MTIPEAVTAYASAGQEYHVQSRGRPERKPEEAAKRILRRKRFGNRLRELRETAGLTLSRAAQLAGMSSPRKLSQYETTCYPPGDIVARLAPHYGVEERDLAAMVLSHSDPILYQGITGTPGYEPHPDEIADYLRNGSAVG